MSANLIEKSKSLGLVVLLALLTSACGAPKQDEANKDGGQSVAEDKGLDTEKLDDLEEGGMDESSTATKAKPKAPKKVYSTQGKKTGTMVDAVVFTQQNEFLGMTTLKLSKFGVRLESPTITCIMLPGQEAFAFNSQNGNYMALTQKSAALLAGSKDIGKPSEQKVQKLGTEKIAGLDCTHYDVVKYYQDPESKRTYRGWSTEIWACKDVGVPPAVVKDTARLTMMPSDLGFPMRIVREGSATGMEKNKGETERHKKRQVINTSACKKTKLDKGDFALLEGFNKVKDEMQLMVSGDDSELLGSDLDEELSVKD